MNGYLIPANTKKSMLIFGLFTKFDLILFVSGVATTLLLLLILDISKLALAILALTPALVVSFLVMPVPNYHNILTLIKSAISFYTNQRKFKWKGWCVPHEDSKN